MKLSVTLYFLQNYSDILLFEIVYSKYGLYSLPNGSKK